MLLYIFSYSKWGQLDISVLNEFVLAFLLVCNAHVLLDSSKRGCLLLNLLQLLHHVCHATSITTDLCLHRSKFLLETIELGVAHVT